MSDEAVVEYGCEGTEPGDVVVRWRFINWRTVSLKERSERSM
jgi:hypothetical protein